MASQKTKFPIYSFSGGLMSDLMSSRVDFQARFAAGRTVSNFMPLVSGALISRAGTQYKDAQVDQTQRAHMIGMNTASGENYLVEISEYLARFWKNGSRITGTPATISSVGYTFTADFSNVTEYKVGGDGATSEILDGMAVSFTSTGTLPTGITSGQIYYARNFARLGFQIVSEQGALGTSAATKRVSWTGTGSGTHTCTVHIIETSAAHGFVVNDVIEIDADGGYTGLAGTWAVKCVVPDVRAVTIDTGTDLVSLTAHGFATGDRVYMRATTVPAPLTTTTITKILFVIKNDDDTFYLSSTLGGAALNFTSAGADVKIFADTKSSQNTRFSIAPLDATLDFQPSYFLTSVAADIRDKYWSNYNDPFDCSTDTYTGGSTATWIGKHLPYSQSDLFDSDNRFNLGYAVLGDSLFLSHENHWPRQLLVNGDTDWENKYHAYGVRFLSDFNQDGSFDMIEAPWFYDGPYTEINTDNNKKIYCSQKSYDEINSYGGMLNRYEKFVTTSDRGRIFRDEGTNTAPDPAFGMIEWPYDSDNTNVCTYRLLGGGAAPAWAMNWRLGLLNAVDGYPHRISFAQNRAIYSRYPSYPTRLEMSSSGNYVAFNPTSGSDFKEVLDSNGISLSVTAQSAGKIVWTTQSDVGLLVGCTGGVFLLSGTDSVLLLPAAVSQAQISASGAANCPPVSVSKDVFYVEYGGLRIRKISSAVSTTESVDMGVVFADKIQSPILGIVYSTHIVPAIWAWHEDGSVSAFVTDPAQEVFSMSQHSIGGSGVVESIGVVRGSDGKDDLYMTVKRTINGGTKRYIELAADSLHIDTSIAKELAVCSDSAITYNSTSTTTITGLDHLEGEDVAVVADGILIGDKTVSSGSITLATAATQVIAGLGYTCAYETLDAELPLSQAVTLGKRKRIDSADVRFYKTLGGKIGRDSSNMNSIDFGAYTTTNIDLFSGVKKEQLNGIHTEDARIRVEQTLPAPMCLQFVVGEGVIYD